MREKLSKIRKDELITGSFILFVMIVIYNLLNYVFQISMAKLLGPADYGILAVLMTIVYIFTIPSEAIQNVMTKYASKLAAKNKNGKIKDVLIRGLKKGLMISPILFLIYVSLSIFISSFLDIDIILVNLTGLLIFVVFVIPVTRGILQGTKKFTSLGLSFIIESGSKVVLTIFFVLIGWQIYGAMTGVLISLLLAFILTFVPLKPIIKERREREDVGNAYRTNLPILVATLSIVLLYSLDVILARRFFSPEVAGQFAFISLIGKVIIFVSLSIGRAMFPISSQEFEKGKKDFSLLKKSLLIVSFLSVASISIYFIIPELIVQIISLNTPEYMATSGILFPLGIAYSFIALSNIIILYKLSINEMRRSSLIIFSFAAMEVVLLSIFNKSLFEYSISILATSAILFVYSISSIRK